MSLTGLLLHDWTCESGHSDFCLFLFHYWRRCFGQFSFGLRNDTQDYLHLPAGRIIACSLHLCASHQRACNGAHLILLSVYITSSAIF